MITNELLQEKYRVQKALAKEANYDLKQYVANSHAAVKEVEAQYGIKFKYGTPTRNPTILQESNIIPASQSNETSKV
jgi:hypothetical protein